MPALGPPVVVVVALELFGPPVVAVFPALGPPPLVGALPVVLSLLFGPATGVELGLPPGAELVLASGAAGFPPGIAASPDFPAFGPPEVTAPVVLDGVTAAAPPPELGAGTTPADYYAPPPFGDDELSELGAVNVLT